jgi:thiamine-phosphate pyrophosphorylase
MTNFIGGRVGRLRLPNLCLITDREQCGDKLLEDVVSQAIDGGVHVVQLREKDLPSGELFALAMRMREVTKNRSLLLINDRLDVAQACGADGAEMPESGLPTPVARWVLGKHSIIGKSVHSVEAAQQAERDDADMVLIGPVFATPSKPKTAAAGLKLIKEVSESVSIPVLAVGGIRPENAAEVIKAGASGVAVISAICAADDPKAAAQALMEAMADGWKARVAAAAETAKEE